MIRFVEVIKEFPDALTLGPLDLVCDRDRTTVLIGPSGCGKSTLLRLVLGLLKPGTGEVQFDGTLVRPKSARELRRRMGYVVQEGGLFPHLSAYGNVALMARHIGQGEAQIAGRIAELSGLTRFPAEALDRFPGELSGGQRQRVSLMRALMLDPDVLLLDEPLGALDPMIRSELQEDLREVFRARKKTVVLVTHDMGEAAYFADHVVLLKDGAVVQAGSVRELLESPAEAFVGEFVRAQRSPLESYT